MMEKQISFPFQKKPLLAPTFFQRLFSRQPKENIIIEINNLLAQRGFHKTLAEEIWGIFEKYKVDLKSKFSTGFLEQFYRDYLVYCLQDKHLSDEEISSLVRLKTLLALNDHSVSRIHNDVASVVYKKTMEEAIADGRLELEEKSFLEKLQTNLQLPDEILKRISEATRRDFMDRFLKSITQDQRLSPEEETELSSIAKSLSIDVQYDSAGKALLDKYRLFWLIENGELPFVLADINLQRGEKCYLFSHVDWYEYRRITKRIRYSGPTMRIKIVKGVYWRMGDLGIQKVSEDILMKIDSGKIYITDKRLIFNGGLKNATIQHSKILDIIPYQNGIQVEKSSGKSPFLQFHSNVDVFAMILERVVRDYNSG
ncbi:MAG: hypothetical protein ACRECJ_03000 [Limisphaerales bacterium]